MSSQVWSGLGSRHFIFGTFSQRLLLHCPIIWVISPTNLFLFPNNFHHFPINASYIRNNTCIVADITHINGEMIKIVGEKKQICWGNDTNYWGKIPILCQFVQKKYLLLLRKKNLFHPMFCVVVSEAPKKGVGGKTGPLS